MAGPGRHVAAAVVAIAVVGSGCGAESVMTTAEFERMAGVAAPVQPGPVAVRQIEGRNAPPTIPRIPELGTRGSAPAEVGGAPEGARIGFADGAAVVAAALSGTGGRSLVEVVLYDGYGIVTTYEAATGNFDRVVVRGGSAEPPDGLPDSRVDDAAASQFGPSDIDWSMVPALVGRTPADLGIADGVVSHVIVEKNLPFTPDLVIRVYVEHARSGGRIDYFADGRPMRSFKN